MTFKAQLSAELGWNWNDGAVDNSKVSYLQQWTDGYDINEAEVKWSAISATLEEDASTTIDLTAAAMTVLGDTLTVDFDTIRAIIIVNESTTWGTTGKLTVGNAASNVWSEPFDADDNTVDVPRDSVLVLSNRQFGWNVDANNKNLKLLATGGAVTYSIAIIGCTTAGSGSSGA